MGNYTALSGKVRFESIGQLEKFKEIYEKEMPEYVDVNDFFIEELDERFQEYTLYINPKYNQFKLIGYPTEFDTFFSFFKDNKKLYWYCEIFGMEEDSGIIHIYFDEETNNIYIGSRYGEEVAKRLRNHHSTFMNECKD